MGLWTGWGTIEKVFCLRSLLGTRITDFYFYLTGLISN
ncbi:MAG: DUF3120 domain-containing protein [cyanobacterium endosymbiont of Rhopalodia yunnanensis]